MGLLQIVSFSAQKWEYLYLPKRNKKLQKKVITVSVGFDIDGKIWVWICHSDKIFILFQLFHYHFFEINFNLSSSPQFAHLIVISRLALLLTYIIWISTHSAPQHSSISHDLSLSRSLRRNPTTSIRNIQITITSRRTLSSSHHHDG